jgi:hypothetical protein
MAEFPFSNWVRLPAGPADPLLWEEPVAQAHQLSSVVWDLDLGLEEPYFPLEDEMRFQGAVLALRQFSSQIWPAFRKVTAALVLYRGPADFQALFSWTETQQARFRDWLEGRAESEALRREFASAAFCHYFQMLAHQLPDELPLLLLLDFEGWVSQTEVLRLLTNERFGHFTVAARGATALVQGYEWTDRGVILRRIDASCGLVLPESRQWDGQFDALLRDGAPVRVVSELFLAEEWEGLDTLWFIPGSLQPQGERKLKGFAAAGGVVIPMSVKENSLGIGS